MTLVDASIWIDHLRRGEARLAELLQEGGVLCHPFVIGELACGHLANRAEILTLLAALPVAPLASHSEALHLLPVHGLFGKGLGWVDLHLLASARLAGCPLWTKDKALRSATQALDL